MIKAKNLNNKCINWLLIPRAIFFAALIFTFSSSQIPPAQAEQENEESTLSDDEIREIMIRNSISRYSGSCACPYNSTRNGSRCGKRSAYSKPGGASPLCYKSDISDKAVEKYRKIHKR